MERTSLLAQAFSQMLGTGERGAVAFVRCFRLSDIIEFCSDSRFIVTGWNVLGIVSASGADVSKRLVPADQAVEQRESKGDPTLLLVDVEGAGAGMDGIYSAAREIPEKDLFERATVLATKIIKDKTVRLFCAEALRLARRVGRHNTISPAAEFQFYCDCATDQGSTGGAVAQLGLWPIQFSGKPNLTDCTTAARLVEKCLLAAPSMSASARVDALMLRDASDHQRSALTSFLQGAASEWWKDSVGKLRQSPELWLNAIRPGFLDQEIEAITLDPWNKKGSDKPYAWSGLRATEHGLEALINQNPQSPKERTKLEIHWRSNPESLPKGAVEYNVRLVYGHTDDEVIEQRVTHTGPGVQRAVFTEADFEQFEGSEKFECHAVVEAITKDREILSEQTEGFTLHFGEVDKAPTSSVGILERSFVEGLVGAEEESTFLETARDRSSFTEDNKHFVVARLKGAAEPGTGKSIRVYRPQLLKDVELQWGERKGAIGRWSIQVRADGSPVGVPEFHDIPKGRCSEDVWQALTKASERLCDHIATGHGFVTLIYAENKLADRYVTAWQDALESGDPELSLANTIEVRTLSGSTIGLIVLPSHPVRVAWHSAYDALAQFARYQEKLRRKNITKALAPLDGAHFPWCLPGIREGEYFLFGDMLGFHAVAMIPDTDREPKAAIAQMARAFGTNDAFASSSLGTADILSKEVERYLELHPAYQTLRVNGLRAGDAMILCRALGKRFMAESPEEPTEQELVSFVLELYPSIQQRELAGRFLTQTSERRRSGAGHIPREDRWIFESHGLKNGTAVPKLRWAKRQQEIPEATAAAHISIAFDSFEVRVEALPIVDVNSDVRPFEVFGLAAAVERRFDFLPEPHWTTFYAPELRGVKHPAGSGLTDRLHRVQRCLHGSVNRHLGHGPESWPVLKTVLRPEQQELFERLHQISDWVVSVDRNAGVEYFDSPREAEQLFDHYVIDCVPERDDLGAFQLVTSTANFEEVMGLLEHVLAEMGLSTSRANCEFALRQLKALSGRMAMRLAGQPGVAGELIALSLVFSNSRDAESGSIWPQLQSGFFIPLDDVPDLLKRYETQEERNRRGDLLFVSLPKRNGPLQFQSIEVKYRRYLRSARDLELCRHVVRQTEATMDRFAKQYFPLLRGASTCSEAELASQRARLARVLRFYANKARRHYLSQAEHKRITGEIDVMLQQGSKYTPALSPSGNLGFVFCPEFQRPEAESIFESGDAEVFLIGPSRIPDTAARAYPPPVPDLPPTVIDDGSELVTTGTNDSTLVESAPASGTTAIVLGASVESDVPVSWSVDIRSNPHLMVVGLPGMGKTTALVNICAQLASNGITPIVFSYHEDIDDRLEKRVGPLNAIDYNGLGFNPMHVSRPQANAYIDNAGMIRDLFGSIFPDLGDLQLESIRDAVKQAYRRQGWTGAPGEAPPQFQLVYDNLLANKRDQRLIMRLNELNDYGFFSAAGAEESPLALARTTVIRVHSTQNEHLQNAFASFVLHHIYQSMFLRGEQQRITHALIIDEAHRASRLKLLPTLAKESRKYGIMLIIASQEARDFQPALFSAVGNYLILRVTDQDAKVLASQSGNSRNRAKTVDQLKEMRKYQALFFNVETGRPQHIALMT